METFENLSIWQESRKVTRVIYQILKENKDFWFRDQIQRASVSIMNNLAEWFERATIPEKIQLYRYAKWSAGEVRSMLYVGLDNWYFSQEFFDENFQKLTYISVGIAKLIQSLEKYKK